jgi:hypothetical protein
MVEPDSRIIPAGVTGPIAITQHVVSDLLVEWVKPLMSTTAMPAAP